MPISSESPLRMRHRGEDNDTVLRHDKSIEEAFEDFVAEESAQNDEDTVGSENMLAETRKQRPNTKKERRKRANSSVIELSERDLYKEPLPPPIPEHTAADVIQLHDADIEYIGPPPLPRENHTKEDEKSTLSQKIGYPMEDPGRYHIEKKLGQGGFGEALLATDEKIGREVVIKRLTTKNMSPDDLLMFRREVVGMATNNPFIVEIYDAYINRETGAPEFTTEFMEGGDAKKRMDTLSRKEQKEGQENWQARYIETAKIGFSIAMAIEAMRKKGFVHRDIKPQNIFFNEDGNIIKLGDFGIAKKITEQDTKSDQDQTVMSINTEITTEGSFIGSPMYAAPEALIRSQDQNEWSDVYSLAATMYEVLTHKTIFSKSESVDGLVKKKMRGELPADIHKKVPQEIQSPLLDIIMQLLSKEKKDRQHITFSNGETIHIKNPGDLAKLIKQAIVDQYPEQHLHLQEPFSFSFPDILPEAEQHKKRIEKKDTTLHEDSVNSMREKIKSIEETDTRELPTNRLQIKNISSEKSTPSVSLPPETPTALPVHTPNKKSSWIDAITTGLKKLIGKK